MLIVPAIDLLAGQCVRLRQGDYNQVETYGLDPVEVAREFSAQGAKRLGARCQAGGYIAAQLRRRI
jgi:phosphoribosylformimino-5-aminoimidazole carboxamide ribotide isomerase